jgi:prophage regulatory protein
MRLLRIKQVMTPTSLSRMTIYRLERAGLFPARRKLGTNSVGWIDEDITAWIASRPSGLVSPRGAAPQLSLFRES